jgi:hypothetical protein
MVLDGQGLDATAAGGGTLLINGVVIASANQSNVANWSQFPALSTIAYTTSGGTGGLINMNVGQFSTLQNQLGSISSLNVSSINGYNANSQGGTIIDTTHNYVVSTSNVSQFTASPQAFAGVTNGLYTLTTGKQYMVTATLNGYNADFSDAGSQLYAAVSLGSASGITFPTVFDSATSSTTSGAFEPRIAQGVVTATGTDGGLQLWLWRGRNALATGSIQVYLNSNAGIQGSVPYVTITQLN